MAAGDPDLTGAAGEVSRLVREIVLWSQRWYAGRCTCGASRLTTSAGHLLTCDLTSIDQDGATLVCAYQIAAARVCHTERR